MFAQTQLAGAAPCGTVASVHTPRSRGLSAVTSRVYSARLLFPRGPGWSPIRPERRPFSTAGLRFSDRRGKREQADCESGVAGSHWRSSSRSSRRRQGSVVHSGWRSPGCAERAGQWTRDIARVAGAYRVRFAVVGREHPLAGPDRQFDSVARILSTPEPGRRFSRRASASTVRLEAVSFTGRCVLDRS